MESPIHVLYLDDEPIFLYAFRAAFRRHFDVSIAGTVREAKQIMESKQVHVIISDNRMPDGTGIDFFESIMTNQPLPIRILITNFLNIHEAIDAVNRAEVYKCIIKPWNEAQLKDIIYKAFELYSSKTQNEVLMKEMQTTINQLEFIARQKLLD